MKKNYPAQSVYDVYLSCASKALANDHRQLLWLSGEQAWCYRQLRTLKPLLVDRKTAAVHSQNVFKCHFKSQQNSLICQTQIINTECYKYLGNEFQTIIFDAYSGLNPDYLAQICGTLIAGGVFILVTPDVDHWQVWDEAEQGNLCAQPFSKSQVTRHFLCWVKRQLQEDRDLLRYSQKQAIASTYKPLVEVKKTPNVNNKAIQEQALLVAQCQIFLIQNAQAHAVIMACRGRGKSAALGLLANSLQAETKLLITASHRSAVLQIEKFCSAAIKFIPPDQLLTLPVDAAEYILLIDEAASIGMDILVKIIHRYPKIVFSTTTQGYEGTGQGFKLRLLEYLSGSASALQLFSLSYPMRWAAEDPLEKWLHKLLLLDIGGESVDANAARGTSIAAAFKQHRLEKIDRAQLIDNPLKLQQMYSLLSQAHYRTTPSDLRLILDSPNMHLWLVSDEQHVIAICLVAVEGPVSKFDVDSQGMSAEQLAMAMHRGFRRPKGNLVPQILIAQEGLLEAASYKFARVVRIATANQYRRLGLARQLLAAVESWALSQSCDYLAASFSLQCDLLQFWRSEGFSLVRVGHQLDKVTASHNALVLKSINQRPSLLLTLQHSFSVRLKFQRRRIFNQSQTFAYIALEKTEAKVKQCFFDENLAWFYGQLSIFAYHHRPLESIGYCFFLLLEKFFDLWQSKGFSTGYKTLLQSYFWDNSALEDIYRDLKISGYRSFVKLMRDAAKSFLALLAAHNLLTVSMQSNLIASKDSDEDICN